MTTELAAGPPLFSLFPWGVFSSYRFPLEFIQLTKDLKEDSCRPTHPWAQYQYWTLLKKCSPAPVFCEFGVARGGTSLFLGKIAGEKMGKVYSFDTFEGSPISSGPKEKPYYKKGDYQGKEQVSQLEQFKLRIAELGLQNVISPVQGDFSSSHIESNFPNKLDFVHIDCNLYDSTLSALERVWNNVADGAIVAIDEYFHSSGGVKKATISFFDQMGTAPLFHVIFPYSVLIIKGEVPEGRPDVEGQFYSFEKMRSNIELIESCESLYRFLERKNYPTKDKAKRFLDFLKSPHGDSHDVYLYLWAMKDYWDSFYQDKESYSKRAPLKK